ncbi:cysteine synthase A [Ruminococcaceae bacterium OttesenSCG-928-L11]|nr:cysteine synthase A [Ruminococcaceae bacterium OttesenSCG-928-L11]
MNHIAHNLTELIGSTPLLELHGYCRANGLHGRILAKLEAFNPAGSAKDRVALAMIRDAEEKGLLQAGATIIEATSGNTGIGLAWVAAARGYQVILTMPDTMSVERRNLLQAYGAQLVLTEGGRGMTGAIEKAQELQASIPGAFIPSQFENPSNPRIHELTTGPEIWDATGGAIDCFVAGVGTGGTITGTGRYLKGQNSAVKVVGVEPLESAVLSGRPAGPHKIQGIGAGFVPAIFDRSVCDEILPIPGEDAVAECRRLVQTEGLLCGISSGAALLGAKAIAAREEFRDKTIVVLLPDTGERYLSTPGYIG